MNWLDGVQAVEERRKNYGPSQVEFNYRMSDEAFDFFVLSGRVLDIGCGYGDKKQFVLRQACNYVGVDVLLPEDHGPELIKANGENLPFGDSEFDSILSYSVLQHVENPEQYLKEASRVLKEAGPAAFLISIDDNPIFMHRFTKEAVIALIGRFFTILCSMEIGNPQNRNLVINARKMSAFEKAWLYSGRVEGWFLKGEARLLWDCGLKCLSLGPFMEIGSYKGRSASLLAQMKPSQLFIVDPFVIQDARTGQSSRGDFTRNMKGFQYELHACKTEELPIDFNPHPGLIHIDGDHGSGVWTDCERLLPMLVSGGIAVFHDWADTERYPTIKKAVAKYTGGWRRIGTVHSALAVQKE